MKTPTSSVDYGGWAEHYASRPYGHFKYEVYPLYTAILAALREPCRVLDVGAGPGHLTHEFFRRHPRNRARFTLLDESANLLAIARRRLVARKAAVRTVRRSYLVRGWERGLGTYDAVVSNNAPFPAEPRKLAALYRTLHARLKPDGVVLLQLPLAYAPRISPYSKDPLAVFLRRLPRAILPSYPPASRRQEQQREREKTAATARHKQALAEAAARGVVLPKTCDWTFLTEGEHVRALRQAGFSAGCIWRKREFVVLLGVKGSPRTVSG